MPLIPQLVTTSFDVSTKHWHAFPLVSKTYNLNHSHMHEGGLVNNIPTTPQGHALQMQETKLFRVK